MHLGLFVWMAGQAGNETGKGAKGVDERWPQGSWPRGPRGEGEGAGEQLEPSHCLRHTGCELCPGSRRWPRARLPGNMLRPMGGMWAHVF